MWDSSYELERNYKKIWFYWSETSCARFWWYEILSASWYKLE